MRVGIMQPYFWPYLGYFQLIHSVDKFIIYDNIEYTKSGWFNRNRYLCNGQDKYMTISIEKASDYLDVKDRKVSANFDREKLKNQIEMSYRKAPFFNKIYPLFCQCVDYDSENLFDYIYYSVKRITEYLGIDTEIIISSTLGIGRELKGKDKVIALCQKLEADVYVNSIGGKSLYFKEDFEENGLQLGFIQMDKDIQYKQFDNEFIGALSILDVLMFNSVEDVKALLERYTIEWS